ncbi:hypothetical protein T459_28973 [Capsicum annuum]|uniref:Uncharacterized protein n=1 Tax=Capsicum annuum TaxID=4072 RepID=A0A2G2YIC4_CAPAN|nr:hypothetical protein T459_28973 [Capsicum annuum]
MCKFSFFTIVHQNSTCGAAENIGTAAKPNGIIHGPVRDDRPNAFSNNNSSILSCIQIEVGILSQTAGSSMFELLDHTLVGPGREGGVRILGLSNVQDPFFTQLTIFTYIGNGQSSCREFFQPEGDQGFEQRREELYIKGRYFRHCISYVVVASVLLGAIVSRHLSVTDPLAARRDALQRSSLDADREYHDSNPPITDSNDVEDVLPNQISFSKELRLQGLGKWLQHCRPPIPPLAGPAPGAILSMSLQVNIDSSGSQYQTQINDHRFPSGVQPWMPISIHNVNSATTMQKTGDLAAPLVVPYLDDKSQIKDAVRMAEIGLKSAGMLDDFKVAIAKYISSSPMSDTNLKFVFDELLEKAREKEEKEAKKRKGLADEFYELLHESKCCPACQQILNDDDILNASVVSCASTDILNADDILDASVVSSASIDIE